MAVQWFDGLYRQYMPRMLIVARRRLEDQSLAEEVVHEAFLRLWERREDPLLQAHPNMGGWLMKTTDLLILNISRRQTALPLTDELAAVLETPAPAPGLEECLPAELSTEDKHLLCCRYQDGLSDDAMARMLGITPAACRVRLCRARRRCAKLLCAEESKFSISSNKTGNPTQIQVGGEAG